jgi:carboxyl-terminal processing protease
MRTLIRVKNRIQDEYYQEITDEEFYDAIFGAVNTEILDAYSAYMTPSEYLEKTLADSGYNQGLGVYTQAQTVDGKPRCLLTMVLGNTPAERAGLREGDFIVGFGDSETEISDGADENALIDFLKGKALGERVYLQLIKENGETQKVSLVKEAYMEGFVSYRSATASYTYHANAYTATNYPLACLNDDTAYIRLTGFLGSANQEFFNAMARFKQEGKKNLVLDLRFNTGGYLDILTEIASVFCKNATEQSPVVAVADYGKNREKSYFTAPANLYDDYFTSKSKIYLLADDGTASASECLIGAMIDYGACAYEDICLSYRGGAAKTYGKGIMQSTYPFGLIGDVDAIKLTTAKIHWPVSDHCIHGVGVTVENGCKTVEEGFGDGEINAALDLFLNG